MDRDLIVQAVLGIPVLGGAVAAAYAIWVRPITHELELRGRLTLALIALSFAGGAIGACGWFLDDPRSFSWDLPPLASRMLAAAGWAFAVLAVLALRRPTWPRVSLVLRALFVYLTPIGTAALLFHRGRFDADAPITYAFFAVVVAMCTASILFHFSPSPALARRTEHEQPARIGALIRIQLLGTAVLVLPWSIALFASDTGPTRLVWAWPGDLLTSRLIASMLLTLGIGALSSLRSMSRARMSLAFQIVYGVGVVAAGALNASNGKPVPTGYMFAFGLVALTSAWALRAAQRSSVSG